jgi:succinate-semialdehyde dehydrogenase/glutarate-semialdehyde dehydrogenase
MTNYPQLELLIDGTWRQGSDGASEPVLNPATEETLGYVPHASAKDLDDALAAADRGFKAWKSTPAHERARIMCDAASLIRTRVEEIALALTLENGKPLAESRMEVLGSADIVEFSGEQAKRIFGSIVPGRAPGVRYLVQKEPVGVTLSFTPWNFPFNTLARKIAPALAAGCSVIAKAAEETPASAVAFVKAFEDAGLPPGVLGLVFGVPAEVSSHLIASPSVKKISLTGSVPVGKHLASLAAQQMQRTTMELGGHAPVIVFDDADVEKAADLLVGGKFRNAGQICISPTRFFVQDHVYDAFVDAFVDRTKSIVVGDGTHPDTMMGPLANDRRLDAMAGLVDDAKAKGASIATGGDRIGNRGFFFAPTVIRDTPDNCRVMTEEPFGPLAPMTRFSGIDEVAERANALSLGLAAYIVTPSLERATAMSDALEVGMVGVNTVAVASPEAPFSGVKDSGYGIEGGPDSLEAYLAPKSVAQTSL